MDGYDLLECLAAIPPGDLTYSEWITIGMSLKESGFPASVWEDWSRGDPARFHPGECERKWATFAGSGDPVTGGSIVQIAREHGWRPSEGHELSWEDELTMKPTIDMGWIESEQIREPSKWDPVSELSRYLELLFEADDYVGYVTTSWRGEDGSYRPTSEGAYDRTAGQLLKALAKCKGDLGKVVGDYDPGAGAWIRFNPLDGQGVKNANVTEWRYALVECDDVPKEKQLPLYKSLNLPIACVVDSGNKSVHAIVHIDAGSEIEYKRRVNFLYDKLQEKGIKIDTQNKNASRLSRMPGVMRGGKKQFIVEEASGPADWTAWREWIEAEEDDLPAIEDFATVDVPELPPPVIAGVLRKGHKMMLAGPSKAGKSFALLELAMAMASGGSWMGWRCVRGRVLYVNMELSRESCLHRLKTMQEQHGLSNGEMHNITIWNLRGKSLTLADLAPKLIWRLRNDPVDMVILDPIYKLIGGNESDMGDVARFCGLTDRLCVELGCAVVYCHHHSKGAQGGKAAADRASGSGVFTRDADALLDMIQLKVPESMQSFCKVSEGSTAWRIEPVLREFPEPGPINVWFDYPLHLVDTSGQLDACKPDTGVLSTKELGERKRDQDDQRRQGIIDLFYKLESEYEHGVVPVQAIVDATGCTPATVGKHLEGAGLRITGSVSSRYDPNGELKVCMATVERWNR